MAQAPSLQRSGGPLATRPSLLQRLVAGGYDRLFDRVDPLGGADHRRRLVQQATGEVLEIGAGTGRNLPLYRHATRVVALEPDPGMRARAHQAARAAQVAVDILDGTAEDLPFPDASFDTVVASLVLCTVPDPARALAEARRVLRSGGTLRFYQHVRADDPRLARWQDRLERPWSWLALGCHPNRDVVAAITAAGFHLLELDRFDFRIMPPLARPHVLGVAARPTQPGAPTGTLARSAAPSAASAEEALRFAQDLARACAGALGGTVAGVILHGSLALGDHLPGRSDVDLLVVVNDPLTDAQLGALTKTLAGHRPRAPGPVDLRVVTRQVAASPTPAPPLEAYLRLTATSGVRVEGHRHPGERDLAVELSVCRAHGRSLLGAAPAELIGEVPDRWVVAAGDAQLGAWQAIGDDPPYAELTVLTACRVWRLAEEGRHCSKTAAGQWALGRDPTLQAVRDALQRRRSDPAAQIDPAQVSQLLAVVRARIAEARDRARGGGDSRPAR